MSTETTQSEYLNIPDAPSIPGLRFRHFKGDEDYPGMLVVNTDSKLADGWGHDLHTLETLKYTYSTTRNHDPFKDVLTAEVDGKMVGYSRVLWYDELDGTRIYFHVELVLPEWRGQGIERVLLQHAEQRASQLEAERGEVATPTYMSTTTGQRMTGLESLLQTEGYTAVRYHFHMETPNLENIADVPMPGGLEIRPAKPEHFRAIFDANTEAFRDHWGASDEFQDYETFVNHPLSQPDLWVVAWDGDQVAGSILNYINHDYNTRFNRKVGHTESISVRRPWRRRGLARAMLAHSIKMHKDLGMEQTVLGVDTENPSGALQLYQSMGYQVIEKETDYRKKI